MCQLFSKLFLNGLSLVILTTLYSCETVSNEFNQNRGHIESICINSRLYDDVEICLPEIDGMKESYSHPNVKARTDLFSYDNNTVLGLYLSQEDYSKIDQFKNQELDDYIKIYALRVTEGIEIGNTEFQALRESYKSNFIQKNWEDIAEKVLDGTVNLSLDKPVMLENYNVNEAINTTLLLSKMMFGEQERVSVFTISMVKLKNSLIFYAYYKNYSNSSTLTQVKAKNDYFGYKLLEVNQR